MDTRTVFSLRKEAKELIGIKRIDKLNEAFQIASKLYKVTPIDERIQKAYAWVLIDLCKDYHSINNLDQALIYFNTLKSIRFISLDDIIESQKTYLKSKFDINYPEIDKAEKLSKDSKHKEALEIFKKLISENRLDELHHEAYGWAIYRYVKDSDKGLTSKEVKRLLMDYLNLKNQRPSLLHSQILNFALNYSNTNSDLNLFKFFELWNPQLLRPEDFENQRFNEKEFNSLVSKVFQAFIENDYQIEYTALFQNMKEIFESNHYNIQHVLDLLREPFFWKIFNTEKEKNYSKLWQLFSDYNLRFSRFQKSEWHSKILSLAERNMQEYEEWRFLDFFRDWNPNKLMRDDWAIEIKDGKAYKPLAIKCIKKSYNIIKSQSDTKHNVDWLIDLYQTATVKFPSDDWLKREKASLLIDANKFDEAITIYKSLLLSLADKAYIWKEFVSYFDIDKDIKIGMLSKAIRLEKNEDFLGDIRLELAKLLIDNNLLENAFSELSIYKRHRELKGWKLSETYNSMISQVADETNSNIDNQELYRRYIPIAEEYAYQNIAWSEFVLIDKWENDKQTEKLKFSNGKDIEFSVSQKRFKCFRGSITGNVFEFKLFRSEKISDQIGKNYPFNPPKIDYKYIPLQSRKSDKSDWSLLKDEYAVIDYINKEKNVVHAISSQNQELFFKEDINKYNINDFITGKLLITKRNDDTRLELKEIRQIDPNQGIEHFSKVLAIVDSVNIEKKLFHFVANNNVHGVVQFRDTDIRPKEGTFLEVRIVKKTDKKRDIVRYKALKIIETEKTSDTLLTTISGLLELKFKSGNHTRDYDELQENEKFITEPDFAFISNIYVSKSILKKYNIVSNCDVYVKAVFTEEKWKVIELEINE